MFRRQGFDWPQPFGQGLGDSTAVPRGPDARAIDAASAAIGGDRFDHHVDVFFPLAGRIVIKNDLAEAGPVDLDARIRLILFNRALTAKDKAASAGGEHGRTHIMLAWIETDGLTR